MHILVLNPGSSSIKFSMFGDGLRPIYEGELSGIGGAAQLHFSDGSGPDLASRIGHVSAATVADAIDVVERAIGLQGLPDPEAVGYRVVHPGPNLRGHQPITPAVMAELRAAKAFAPLHDPEAVAIIEHTMRHWPSVPHVACFDTVFHQTMPEDATVYALPEAVQREGVHRYGFHGLSCESVVEQMRDAGVLPARMAIAHLGSGCSVTACVDGKSVDTTMGLTPTGGVVMGTRPGDLDPGVVFYLLRRAGATMESVEQMLNHDAGLKALGGINDMRTLRERAMHEDKSARLAVRIFSQSVARAIAGFAGLHAVDTVVFTGGIGEHDSITREEIAGILRALGMQLDPAANCAVGNGLRKVSPGGAKIATWVAPAEEDRMIARHVEKMLA